MHTQELIELRRENDRLREQTRRLLDITHEEYWLWQGDGEDHLESLTCPVVIRPEVLATLIAGGKAALVESYATLRRELMDADCASNVYRVAQRRRAAFTRFGERVAAMIGEGA